MYRATPLWVAASNGRKEVVSLLLKEGGSQAMPVGNVTHDEAAGDAQPDVRWDVYGFGATAYRLLTGQYPRFSANIIPTVYRRKVGELGFDGCSDGSRGGEARRW